MHVLCEIDFYIAFLYMAAIGVCLCACVCLAEQGIPGPSGFLSGSVGLHLSPVLEKKKKSHACDSDQVSHFRWHSSSARHTHTRTHTHNYDWLHTFCLTLHPVQHMYILSKTAP